MALTQRELDIQHMLTCQVHIGTHNLEHKMKDYVWRRRSDGVHIINVAKTWEKLHLAARIIVAIENPKDVVAISASIALTWFPFRPHTCPAHAIAAWMT